MKRIEKAACPQAALVARAVSLHAEIVSACIQAGASPLPSRGLRAQAATLAAALARRSDEAQAQALQALRASIAAAQAQQRSAV